MLIKIEINGTEYEVKEGEYILKICQKLGVFVPHLCYLENMLPAGRCGLCAVEINDGQVALSCMTQVKADMKIKTSSEKLDHIRKNNIARMLKNHNIDCFNCSKCGICILQEYASRVYDCSDSCDNFEGKDFSEGRAIKLREHLFFDESKCVHCTRCITFLSEICKINLTSIDTLEKTAKSEDLIGNILDICPTAALTQLEDSSEVRLTTTIKTQTYDVSSVFTPKISILNQGNEILNISSVKSCWIRDDIKFIKTDLDCRKSFTDSAIYNNTLEKLASEILDNAPEKKVFILGDNTDIFTFLYIKYLASHIDNVLMAIDDHRIPKNLISNIGLVNEDLPMMDLAIFIGDRYLSDKYYVTCLANNIKGSVSVKFKDLNAFVSKQTDEKLYYSCNTPYVFVYSDVFKSFSVKRVLNGINKLEYEYEEKFKKKLSVKILPRTLAQMLARYADNYLPTEDLFANFNKHDIKVICIVGELGYKPDYNDIPTIQHSVFNNKGQKKDEYLSSKHFLEDSGFFINIFGKVIKTNQILESKLRSNKEFIFDLMSIIYGSDFQDINEEIHQEIRDVFFK